MSEVPHVLTIAVRRAAHIEDQNPSSPADTYGVRDSPDPSAVRDSCFFLAAGRRSTRNLDLGGSASRCSPSVNDSRLCLIVCVFVCV